MVWRILLLVPLALCATVPAQAGILFKRNSKQPAVARPATPPDPVGELIRALRSEPDERRRAEFVDELARFDLKQSPHAGGALIETLQNDPSPLVRNETADALGKMRPLTQQVGQALDQAFNSDPSSRVRLTARNSLVPFTQAGYKPANRSDVAATDTPRVVPTAPGRAVAPPAAPATSPLVKKNIKPPVRETIEPPLAGVSPEPVRTLSPSKTPTAPLPSIMHTAPPQTIADPTTTGPTIKPQAPKETKPAVAPPANTTVAKPAPAKTAPAKPAPAPTKPAPAKPEVEGPILIPPE